MRDEMNSIHLRPAIPPAAAVTDSTPFVSQIIDRAGFGALTFVILTGVLADADGTFTVLVEDGDNAGLTDASAVDDLYLVGNETLAGFNYAADNACRKVGYVGWKRYVRLTVTPGGNTGNAFVAAVALLGMPSTMPAANPPA